MTENDLDTLRRAALLVRETAAVATPGPWETWVEASVPRGRKIVTQQDDIHGICVTDDLFATDAEWVALMGPDVGLVLADWLDDTVESLDAWLTSAQRYGADPGYQDHQYMPVVRFARALLREEGDT